MQPAQPVGDRVVEIPGPHVTHQGDGAGIAQGQGEQDGITLGGALIIAADTADTSATMAQTQIDEALADLWLP